MKVRIKLLALMFSILPALVYSQIQQKSNQAEWESLAAAASYVEGEYYFESFEGDVFPPAGWKAINIRGHYNWDNDSYYNARTGSSSAYVNYDWLIGKNSASNIPSAPYNTKSVEDTVELDWLISPRYSAAPGDSLIFYALFNNYNEKARETLFVIVSLEEETPIDNASLNMVFDDTLFVIPIDTIDDERFGWRRYAASLEKYANQKIYIGFKDWSCHGYGVLIDDVQLGKRPAADAATLDAYVKNFIKKGNPLDLAGSFVNLGDETQSFYANCEIPQAGYLSRILCENIVPDSVVNVDFNAWTSTEKGTYQVYIYTDMENDSGKGNDTIKTAARVLDELSPAAWHTEKEGSGVYPTAASYGGDPAFEFNKYIFAFSSVNVSGETKVQIRKYDKEKKTWDFAAYLPQNIYDFTPVQIGGKIFIAGRETTSDLPLSLYIYDVEKNSFETGADMLSRVYSYAAGSYGDSIIYFVGNRGYENLVQIYNIRTDTWNYGSPIMDIKGYNFFGSVSGSKILIIAQGDGMYELNDDLYIGTIDAEDPYTISWRKDKFPGGSTYRPSCGSWNGKKSKYIFFRSSEIWAYDVQCDEWKYSPASPSLSYGYSNLIPVVRNDSVYIVILNETVNEWLYIGHDELQIGVEDEPNIAAPAQYSLSQNYPNPFNPSTKIKYSLRDPVYVRLTVYDMLGREVKTLINEFKNAGDHEVIFNSAELNLASGIYLYRIKAGSFVQTKKLMLIK